MEERILDFLNKHPYTENELNVLLGQNVHDILLSMLLQGTILFYKRQYMLPSRLKAFKAKIISMKDNFAFAKFDDKEDDAYISDNNLHGAFLDDAVFIRRIYGNSKPSYEVVSIIKRSRDNIVGEIRVIKGLFILDVKGLTTKNHDFIIQESPFALLPHSIILARIVKTYENYTLVKPIEILGSKNDPGIDILRIICSHDAPTKFPSDVMNQVKKIPLEVEDKDLINRTSFLDHVIVTIDGETAKDFDDAVEVRKDENGYHVGVHIADVSHYVRQNSHLDKEAELRSTSIYCADRVVPMLPFELSNGICSLNPGQKRLVQSVLFDMDYKGNITSCSLHKSVICSSARLTYTYVNQVLNENKYDNSFSEKVNQMIPLLKEVADLIRKRRVKEGCLDLTSTELEFDIAEDDKIISVSKRKQDVGEQLIEDLMIQANELVTLKAREKGIPFFYRIHESPKIKRIDEFVRLSEMMGYPCEFSAFSLEPKKLQKHMNNIKDDNKKGILSFYLLRALAKARYSSIHHSHFGLALENYTHFTSPIRRYPDLIVHRLLDYYFFGIGKEQEIKELEENLNYLAESTSSRERRAQAIEREVDDLCSCKYMSQFIGNTFDAIIVSLTAYGMYVELENGIEGFVPFDFLDEYFTYYESNFTAVSSLGTRLKLGDKVKVILESCNEEKTQIIFSLPSHKKKNTIKKEKKSHGRKNKTHRK